jgi:hypothetical protein
MDTSRESVNGVVLEIWERSTFVTYNTSRKLAICYWKYGSEAPSANLRVIPVVNQ